MSVLDPDYIDMAHLQMENKRLQDELKRSQDMLQWYEEKIFDEHLYDVYLSKSRSRMMTEMYELIYGDTPLCDTCDGRTGFFLEIDKIYDAIHSNKWLLKILRLGRYYKSKFL